MGYTVIHRTDIRLNREELNTILNTKNLDYTELYNRVTKKYGLNLSYKGFMNALSNRTEWKLLYAWAIAETLDVDIRTIFDIVEVDIKEKIKQKEMWKEKYEKRR